MSAVASRDASRAVAYAATWNIPSASTSYDALLGSDVDIVYLPLPNSLHVEWTLRALDAGKHVLCEKPLALTAADVDAIADASWRAGRTAMEGFMYRHHALTRRVREVVASGAIGDLCAVQGGFSYARSRDNDVRLDASLGGGALWDVGCYPVSYAHMFGTEAVSVSALQQLGPTGVDEQFAGTITFANGIDAQVLASFRAAYQTFVRLSGTSGVVHIDRPFRPNPTDRFRVTCGDVVQTIEVAGEPMFVDQVRNMEDVALGIAAPAIPLAESRAIAVTMTSLLESARTGCRVDLAR